MAGAAPARLRAGLEVNGPVRIVDADGNEYDTAGQAVIALRRCGGSTNKPFCDGTHSKIGFSAASRAVQQAEEQGQ